MPRYKFAATFAGLVALGLSAGGPAWSKDKDEKPSNEPTKRAQVQQQIQQKAQQQIQQRVQTHQPPNSGNSAPIQIPPRHSNNNPPNNNTGANNALRNQVPQQIPQQPRLQPPLGNLPNNPSQGTLRNLPSNNAGPKLQLPNPGQNLNNNAADHPARQRLQQQVEDMRKQQTKAPGNTLNNDPVRQRIETLKPQPGNQPGNADQARDRLKNAQDQIKNLPSGDLKNRLPNAGDKLPNAGNRLPNAGNNPPNIGNRLPNAGDKLPNVAGPLKDRIDLGKTGRPTTPLKIDKNGQFSHLKDHPELKEAFDGKGIRHPDDLKHAFDKLQNGTAIQAQLKQSNLKVTDLSGAFQTKIRHNDVHLQQLAQTNIGRKININQQFNLAVNGDVARQLNLNQALVQNGGWAKRSYLGPVYGGYTKSAFSSWYAGPGFYPSYCWTPIWSPWVSWTYWNHCLPIYDPRPFWCRPVYGYNPCPPIVYYQYPVWQPLPIVTCGTWVDVPPAIVDTGFDLQLLAVRFVDPGHREENDGPRLRVWVRNNSRAAIGVPFNVTLVAANGTELVGELPQAGVTVPNMDADTVMPIDIRLPYEANRMNILDNGQRTPFTHLHVLVDSHRDLQENDEANNGAVIARTDILPVDPAAFSTDVTAAAPGSLVSLAGEGFGPEPGELLVIVDGKPVQAEIFGWYDLGVNFKLPNIDVNSATPVELLVVRGDGAASNPVTIALTPEQLLGEAPLPPVPAP